MTVSPTARLPMLRRSGGRGGQVLRHPAVAAAVRTGLPHRLLHGSEQCNGQTVHAALTKEITILL